MSTCLIVPSGNVLFFSRHQVPLGQPSDQDLTVPSKEPLSLGFLLNQLEEASDLFISLCCSAKNDIVNHAGGTLYTSWYCSDHMASLIV